MHPQTDARSLRCISGILADTKSFTDNNDGTVKDNVTGLFWQKCTRGQNYDSGNNTCKGEAVPQSWEDALNYCNTLNLAGKIWRLPNLNELQSIVDYTINGSAINNSFGIGSNNYNYWTSTTYGQDTTRAWIISFDEGYTPYLYEKINFENVTFRCIAD